jgi:hypothetical protein
MRISMWLAPLVLLSGLACSSQPAAPAMPPFDNSVSVKELMANMMDPTADIVWESVGTIVTKEGTFERAPETDEEWDRVKAHAIILVESGNLLLLPSRSGNNPEWNQLTVDFIAQAKRVVEAASKHDKQGVFDRGADMYDACVNCHKRFDPLIRDAK